MAVCLWDSRSWPCMMVVGMLITTSPPRYCQVFVLLPSDQAAPKLGVSILAALATCIYAFSTSVCVLRMPDAKALPKFWPKATPYLEEEEMPIASFHTLRNEVPRACAVL